MKLAFLIAVHKLDQYLPLAIDSIVTQTDSQFECVVVANNCDDDLWEYLVSINDSRISCYRTEIGQLCFNLNYGLGKTDADYVMRMDADDVCDPNRVLNTRRLLSESSVPDVLSMECKYIDCNGSIIHQVKKVTNSNMKNIGSILWYRNPICHPAAAVRRKSLLAVGGYSWGFASEDYDLWLRMNRAGMKFESSLLVGVQYRIREGQSKGGLLPYSEVAGLMMRELLLTKNIKFFFGVCIAVLKVVFRAKA